MRTGQAAKEVTIKRRKTVLETMLCRQAPSREEAEKKREKSMRMEQKKQRESIECKSNISEKGGREGGKHHIITNR